MSTSDALATALSDAVKAHSAWKMRLRRAASRKEQDLPVDTICRDDCCTFGKWLYALPAEIRNTADAQKVKALHADFHKEAGHVAQQINDAQFATALEYLEGENYTKTSRSLTRAVAAWKLNVLVKQNA
ncbi:diguanylate cyclase [Thalassovita autumnalis]|uniref:Diguanylate cyclase n=1 Tax=Thalassovita autumnalis TaxID=2072972 RepID=A0A0P1FV91_9RHOB|nr:CZB domain-containing protein [Thalassovita autumnalis]CUH69565.1 diguanylate cyclase [Thalassovita autumnalis]CUH72968.1 diguanylate cyclase [Thalassovita autumnalis]